MKFDYVVGNPPYVRVDNIPESYREKYSEIFKDLLVGKWDIYIPFIYKGIEWLNNGGKFGYIVSNKFFLLESGLPLRKYILSNCNLEQIIDLSGVDVFAESMPAPAIVALRREYKMPTEHKIEVDVRTNKDVPEKLRKEIKEYDKIRRLEKTIEYLLNNVSTYEVKQGRFEKDPHLLFTITIPDENVPLIERIESHCKTFDTICNDSIGEGDTTREEEQTVIGTEDYKELSIDVKPTYKMVVRGGDIIRYVVQWAGDYIKQLHEIPTRPRLLVKDIAKRLTVAYDNGICRCLRTIYCAYPQDDDFDIKYILGLLNSKLMHFYYTSYFYTSKMSPREGNFRFRTQFLKRLPIQQSSKEFQRKIITLVERIIALQEERLNLQNKVVLFPSTYLEEGWLFEDLVNKISAQNLSKSLYKISENSLQTNYFRDLYSKENFRIHLSPSDYVDFSSEEIATYVWQVLAHINTITKRELLELKIPQQSHLKNLLNQYRRDKEQIVRNVKAVEEMETQIDGMVYELYDVYRERKKIEDYLVKFQG
jgi:hypothetical protein